VLGSGADEAPEVYRPRDAEERIPGFAVLGWLDITTIIVQKQTWPQEAKEPTGSGPLRGR